MRVKFICESCGHITLLNEGDSPCPICNTKLTKVGFIDGHKLINVNGEKRMQWLENKLGHPLSEEMINLRKSYYENEQLEREKQKEEERRRNNQIAFEQGKRLLEEKSRVPKCPICGSTNLRKISTTTRVVKTAAFGAIGAMDDAGKTYRCENCGSKF